MKISRAEIEQRIYQLRQLLGDVFELDAVYHSGNQTFFQGRPLFPQNVLWRQSIQERLTQYGYTSNIEQNGDRFILTVSKMGEEKEKKIPWTNILLFCASIITSLFAYPFYITTDMDFRVFSQPGLILREGGPFAIGLFFILTVHEFGHYVVSKKRRIDVSFPYFMPAPTIFGTLGAFIKSKSPFKNRKELIEVGSAGPIAGFIVSVIVFCFGLSQANVVQVNPRLAGHGFGMSILLFILQKSVIENVPSGYTVALNPILLAGWAGILVTMLNLIPIGQLDGGHILYGLFGRKQHFIARAMVPLLFVMGLLLWPGWFIWGGIALIVRPAHPPTLNDSLELDLKRKIIGWVALVIFVISFIPVPIR